MRAVVVIVLLAALAGTARADDGAGTLLLIEREEDAALEVGFADVLEVAVKRSPTLLKSELDVQVAAARVMAARGVDDYVLDSQIRGDGSRRTDPGIDGNALQRSDGLLFDLGIARALPWGGAVRVAGEYTLKRSEYFDTFRQTDAGSAVSLSLTQPLLAGFGEEGARADRLRAQADRGITLTARDLASIEAIRDVVLAYWELSYAVEERRIRRQALELAREQLAATEARVRSGRLPGKATAEVEVTVSLREEGLLLAHQQVLRRSMELRRLIGMEIGVGNVALQPSERPFAVLDELPSLDTELAMAMRASPRLAVARAEREAAEVELDVADDQFLPKLDLGAGLRVGGEDTASTFGAVGDTGELVDFNIGLVFRMPLGRRAESGTRRAADRLLQKAKVSEAELRSIVARDVVDAVQSVWLAQKRIQVLEKSVELAQVNLRAEKARFAAGRTTNFEVLRRQDELFETRIRRVRAHTDYLGAMAQLDAVTGKLLARYGIELGPRR